MKVNDFFGKICLLLRRHCRTSYSNCFNRGKGGGGIRRFIKWYKSMRGEPPRELFLHGKVGFSDNEWEGFQEAVDASTKVVGVRITDDTKIKLYRKGWLALWAMFHRFHSSFTSNLLERYLTVMTKTLYWAGYSVAVSVDISAIYRAAFTHSARGVIWMSAIMDYMS